MTQSVSVPIPSAIRRCEAVDGLAWVYAYYDRDDHLLYVGYSRDPLARAAGHRSQSAWWRFVASASAWQKDAGFAYDVERDLIRFWRPIFNVVYSTGSDKQTVEYLAGREAWDLVDALIDQLGLDEPASGAA